MWADVKKNSSDFNAWTSLLTHVEQNVLLIGEFLHFSRSRLDRRCDSAHLLSDLHLSSVVSRHPKRSWRLPFIFRTLPLLLRILEKTCWSGAEKRSGRGGTRDGEVPRDLRERSPSHSSICWPLAAVYQLHQNKAQRSRGGGRGIESSIQASHWRECFCRDPVCHLLHAPEYTSLILAWITRELTPNRLPDSNSDRTDYGIRGSHGKQNNSSWLTLLLFMTN